MVAGQDRYILQIPLGSDRVGRSGTDTRRIGPVLTHFLSVNHHTVTRLLFRVHGVKTAIDVDTRVDLKGGAEHRTAGRLRGLRRYIGTGSDIDRTGGQVVRLHVLLEVVDGILHTVFGVRPGLTVITVRSVRVYITYRIRLRMRECAHTCEHY